MLQVTYDNQAIHDELPGPLEQSAEGGLVQYNQPIYWSFDPCKQPKFDDSVSMMKCLKEWRKEDEKEEDEEEE